MSKWLVRTQTNHILGPIHKDKLLELLEGGTLEADDEICSGNGYWFFVREKELLQRFVYEGEPQGFNPICNAPKSRELLRVEPETPLNLSKPQSPTANQEPMTSGNISITRGILNLLLFILAVGVLVALYYRKRILKQLIENNTQSFSIEIFPHVYAQELSPKKKTFSLKV